MDTESSQMHAWQYLRLEGLWCGWCVVFQRFVKLLVSICWDEWFGGRMVGFGCGLGEDGVVWMEGWVGGGFWKREVVWHTTSHARHVSHPALSTPCHTRRLQPPPDSHPQHTLPTQPNTHHTHLAPKSSRSLCTCQSVFSAFAGTPKPT